MPVVSLDLSVLATPARSSGAGSTPAPVAFAARKVALPERLDGALASRLANLRSQTSLINEKAAAVAGAGEDHDLKTSFTVYRALDGLRTLSEAAAAKTTPVAQRADLARQFQRGLADVQNYLAAAKTDKLTLQFGAKASKVEAVLPSRAASTYSGITATPDAVTSADSIDIKLGKGTKQDIVHVDFADITGPITLRSIADLINAKIAAIPERDGQGNILTDASGHPLKRYNTSFSVVRTNDVKAATATHGLSIMPGTLERVSLVDTAAAPRAYLVNGIGSSAQLRSIDDLFANPAIGAAQKIAAKDTDASALAASVYAATKTKTSKAPGDQLADLKIAASAVDGDGFLYVVGQTRGALGDQTDTKSTDIFLTKYDSNGAAVFSRKLGSNGTATGSAIAIDSSNNVIVAGSFDGKLGADSFKGQDTLVLKYDSAGREIFARQLDSAASDAASALTVDANGDIYVGGTVSGALNGQTSTGGQDSFVAKLNGDTGALLAATQFGTSGKDALAALAIAADGALLVASTENKSAMLRRYASADLSAPATTTVIGALGGGTVTSLAIDAVTGRIAIGGTTGASLNGNALAGAADGFIAQLDAGQNITSVTQLGTAAADRVTSLQFTGGTLFAAGITSGDLAHVKSGSSDAFLARLDANGGIENIAQVGTPLQEARDALLAIANRGPGVLAKLGFRQGDINPEVPASLVDRTILRAGDQFSLSIDGKTKTVTLSATDDAKSLTKKISAILGRAGEAVLTDTRATTKISIRATTDARIDLLSGPADRDALAKLNLAPGQLRASNILFNTGKSLLEQAETPGGSFGLELNDTLALTDQKTASVVLAKIDTALETTRRAYRALYYDPAREALARQLGAQGAVPAYLTTQISQYKDALSRLTGSSGTTA